MSDRSDMGASRSTCPHCGSERVHGHGSFARKDGSRQPRLICRCCGRTFNQQTFTPLHYIKKRNNWGRLGEAMARRLSVRRAAKLLRVHVVTAFRWRHRVLAALATEQLPTLSGTVYTGFAFVPYSEKGRRRPRVVAGPDRFRRFIHAQPSCVLLACDSHRQLAVMIGHGRPTATDLRSHLTRLLRHGSVLWTEPSRTCVDACRSLGLSHRQAPHTMPFYRGVQRLRGYLHAWLASFQGVATRYLKHYLTWQRYYIPLARLHPRAAGWALLSTAQTLRMPSAA